MSCLGARRAVPQNFVQDTANGHSTLCPYMTVLPGIRFVPLPMNNLENQFTAHCPPSSVHSNRQPASSLTKAALPRAPWRGSAIITSTSSAAMKNCGKQSNTSAPIPAVGLTIRKIPPIFDRRGTAYRAHLSPISYSLPPPACRPIAIIFYLPPQVRLERLGQFENLLGSYFFQAAEVVAGEGNAVLVAGGAFHILPFPNRDVAGR